MRRTLLVLLALMLCAPTKAGAFAQANNESELVAGNTAFALDVYAVLRLDADGNLLFSPYSISQALAMTYAGADGETADQMAETLSFVLQQPALHEAFAALNGLPVVPTTDFSNSVIAGPGTPFYFLGDLFVLPRPLPFANVFSLGDVLIGMGGAWFIVAAMHGRGLGAVQRPVAATGNA